MGVESRLERDHLTAWDFDPSVVGDRLGRRTGVACSGLRRPLRGRLDGPRRLPAGATSRAAPCDTAPIAIAATVSHVAVIYRRPVTATTRCYATVSRRQLL